jgi:hypothetical protein
VFLRVLCGKKMLVSDKGREMPEGYYVPFSAIVDAPYWHYKFGQGPKPNNSAGIIPKGGLIHVQGPAGAWGGTHQSAYLMGVGRIIVKIGDFQPAPALATNS